MVLSRDDDDDVWRFYAGKEIDDLMLKNAG